MGLDITRQCGPCICAGLTCKQRPFEDTEVMLQLPGSQSVQHIECMQDAMKKAPRES